MSVVRPGRDDATLRAASAPFAPLHELVEIHLRRIDQRYTTGRQSVVELLATSGRPLSISDISSAIPEIPRSSAYRHLSDLQRAGVVRRIAANERSCHVRIEATLEAWAPRSSWEVPLFVRSGSLFSRHSSEALSRRSCTDS